MNVFPVAFERPVGVASDTDLQRLGKFGEIQMQTGFGLKVINVVDGVHVCHPPVADVF